MPNQNESWRERFDAAFELDGYGTSTAVQDLVKSFIAYERNLAKQEERDRILGEIGSKIHWIDGDEVLSDFDNGYNQALSDIKNIIK